KLRVRFHRSGGNLVAQGTWRGQTVYLIKPQCFMNVTGPATIRATRKLRLAPADLVFVYDDIDLPLGKVRLRLRGSAGGHNGVRSLITTVGPVRPGRVRAGRARPPSPPRPREGVVDPVLSALAPGDPPAARAACPEAVNQPLKRVEAHGPRRF